MRQPFDACFDKIRRYRGSANMPAEIMRVPLRLRFSGTKVDLHGVDLYDGATSFQGFAQAIQIAVHAYQTKEIASRATALHRGKLYFESPKSGSVIFNINALLEASSSAVGKSPNSLYDFLKISFLKATGQQSSEGETASVRALVKDETFFDQLSENLEGSLQRAHRAIDKEVTRITLERPRAELVSFNKDTSEWVNTRDENPKVEQFWGNVTRYNSVSGNGRAYIKELKKIVPIRPGKDFPDGKRGNLTWSLHGSTIDGSKELEFLGSRIESARGEAKRLILEDCSIFQPEVKK